MFQLCLNRKTDFLYHALFADNNIVQYFGKMLQENFVINENEIYLYSCLINIAQVEFTFFTKHAYLYVYKMEKKIFPPTSENDISLAHQ